MADSFTHLHLHTEFSMLDGAARVKDVIAAAVTDGQPAIGITDHGNMYGVLDFYKEAKAQGVVPVIGTELYMAAESRHERPARRGGRVDLDGDVAGAEKANYHLTVLAETTEGYRNLMKLSSAAYLEGFYGKPRADWELLDRYHEGVIATTGCLGGLVLQSLLKGDQEGATAQAARLQDIFGKDNLFVELQDHGIPDQHKTNPMLLELATRIGAPVLATNDSHYTNAADAVSHDALLCVQTGSSLDDPTRFKFSSDQHWLKTAAEMRHLFREVPESCDNTLWIAERSNVEIEFNKPKLPEFPLPPGFADADAYLRHLTLAGAQERYAAPVPGDVMERLDFELGVIKSMGFSDYFLVVWDLIRYARERGIRVGPGRGSAAGCCVAYCLRIVDLDPIKYDLLFERFLNPGRKQMPDIDMDFDSRFRGEMIKYAAERYGADHVAQIVTFSTIKARAAVRDAARVLGYPYSVGDRVAKAMPPLVMGRDTPLYACLEVTAGFEDGYKMATELREMYNADPDVKKVVDVARGLEGLRRQDGIHAAAVVITADPLTEYLPIQRKPMPGSSSGDRDSLEGAPIVTQYEMHGVEELGLLKMDFLGLRNLDVIEMTLDLIEASTGERPDIDNIPSDDDDTLALLRRAESIGVFQLEGGPMRALMKSLAPTSFDDVAALVALYRPGPMAANMHNDYADRKNGRKPISYIHPDLEELLGDTQGLMIYQESMMRVAQKFAGYSLEEADNLRKACLPAGSMMRTVDGPVAIEQVMALGDKRVETVDLATDTTVLAAVDDVWSVGRKAVYRLTTESGHVLEATADHPLYVDGGWRPLGAIRSGDFVGVVERPPNFEAFSTTHMYKASKFGWDVVESVEFSRQVECFDFRMADPERPYAVVEDVLVHNCGKKVRSVMEKERSKFIDGCVRTGYGEKIGKDLFAIIEPFADYAFGKSHSYGYGFIAYQTAWLKAHYPVQYFAALLTSVKDDKDKTAVYLAECRALGIQVLVPDVNLSASEFTARDQTIPFGMSAIRNVGEGLVERMVVERDAGGPFVDFYDFCDRVDPVVLNKRTVESLIKGGAFDAMSHPRQGLCLVFEQIVDRTMERRRREAEGQFDLFSALGDTGAPPEPIERMPIPDMEFDKLQKLAFEKEMLGLYVSDHPLLGAEGKLRRQTETTIVDLREAGDGGGVKWVGGVVTALVRKYTKKGELMATFVLEDLQSAMEVWVFPRTMQEYGYLLADDAIICVKGRIDTRDEEPKLVCMELKRPDLSVEGAEPLQVALPLHAMTDDKMEHLKRLLVEHPGESPVLVRLGDKMLRLPDEFNVDASNGLCAELRVLLGADCLSS